MPSTSQVSRRQFLALAASAPLVSSVADARGAWKNVPIGIELYTVRTHLERDLRGAVTAVAKMGYEVVEFYAPYFSWTPAQARDVRTLLDDLGITCRSTHNGPPSFTTDGLEKAIELNTIIGSSHIIMSSAGRVTGLDGWKALAERMTAVSETLRPLGMTSGFHNHQEEWRPLDGERPMDVLARGTPEDFVLQFDAGTCVEVGADPVAWIKAHPGRIGSIHLKDWGAGQGRGYAVAFGEGGVPWRPILEAAESVGGVQYYLMEQEVTPDQFAMAKYCLDQWRKLRA